MPDGSLRGEAHPGSAAIHTRGPCRWPGWDANGQARSTERRGSARLEAGLHTTKTCPHVLNEWEQVLKPQGRPEICAAEGHPVTITGPDGQPAVTKPASGRSSAWEPTSRSATRSGQGRADNQQGEGAGGGEGEEGGRERREGGKGEPATLCPADVARQAGGGSGRGREQVAWSDVGRTPTIR